jgi:DNA repair protein RecO (recombination protein O)
LRRFERDLLEHLGYGLNPAIDAQTGISVDAGAIYGYRHELGPVPWRSGADGPKISGAALIALAMDIPPTEAELPSLRRWMRGVIAAHLDGVELQAWKLLSGASLRQSE